MGLPRVLRLDGHELLGVRLEGVGDPEERQRALARACVRFHAGKAACGGLPRGVDVRLAQETGISSEGLAGRRVDQLDVLRRSAAPPTRRR